MKSPQKNGLEWAIFSFSLALVLAVLVYLTYETLQMNSGGPELEVELGQTSVQTGSPQLYQVPLTIRNQGSSSAEAVVIEVTLTQAGEEIEQSQVEVALVPYQSARQGVVVFQNDPRQGELAARVVSYLHP